MRLKLTLAYHGATFSGWQSQADGSGVQDHLEDAFETLLGTHARVHGAGRTDAGVHALGQVAHVEVERRDWKMQRWVQALNANLPSALRVLSCRPVADSFHARHSARGKIYRYRIWAAAIASPFQADRAWHIAESLDSSVVGQAAQFFVGEHDFASFAANRGKKEESTVRTVHAARVRRRGPEIVVEFDGSGFLYKMVRLMVGTLVRCGTGHSDPAKIRERLRHPHQEHARFVAPAHGLYLVRVRY